jgi:hypothetical protein
VLAGSLRERVRCAWGEGWGDGGRLGGGVESAMGGGRAGCGLCGIALHKTCREWSEFLVGQLNISVIADMLPGEDAARALSTFQP